MKIRATCSIVQRRLSNSTAKVPDKWINSFLLERTDWVKFNIPFNVRRSGTPVHSSEWSTKESMVLSMTIANMQVVTKITFPKAFLLKILVYPASVRCHNATTPKSSLSPPPSFSWMWYVTTTDFWNICAPITLDSAVNSGYGSKYGSQVRT